MSPQPTDREIFLVAAQRALENGSVTFEFTCSADAKAMARQFRTVRRSVQIECGDSPTEEMHTLDRVMARVERNRFILRAPAQDQRIIEMQRQLAHEVTKR